ncbi:hypothetical protein [Flavobacterium sp. SLB02]|jgi:hypothetical protein|uniref:hypothetical protein n=1 Tax=Flavobacterium sp. SLB02 TaxID=2665645 RepID=UPI0012A94018|nr:hypothetical protein [Flavobacterium sp. SLB02]QGK72815.1 hypothetical protein GIY83_01635 [Flavobacterium sp. SLB02]
MKNAILIEPVDEEMTLLANAVLILNNYKAAGFENRSAFVELVMGEDKSYHTPKGMTLLNNFWACRVKNKELNDDLTRILEKLKIS